MPLKRDYLPPFSFFIFFFFLSSLLLVLSAEGSIRNEWATRALCTFSFFSPVFPSFLRLSPRWHVLMLVFVWYTPPEILPSASSPRRPSRPHVFHSLRHLFRPFNVSPISVISGSQDSRSCETPLAAWFTRVTEYRTPRAVDVRRFTFSSAERS